MRTIDEWFAEYSESHQNPTNKMIHWICVPAIFFSVIALLYTLKIGEFLNAAHVVVFMSAIFYIRLSWKLAISIITFSLLCIAICYTIESALLPLQFIALCIFAAAWIGQFYGHHIEGKKPSFLKDIQFLLIGPVWLLGFVYKKLGVSY